ncbi:MAG: DUF1326 domain-containing protein [Defluviicoccus sp.]|nr:MAG: DUF1326 domain-containing protein [Defluviicoccus sp.]
MAYTLEGDLLEVCDCKVLCPCWIGEDPDNGTCESALAYRILAGQIDGVDVSGLAVASAVKIPGNVLNGGWRRRLFIDDRATDEQMTALVDVLTGRRGGPLADLAALIDEELEPKRTPVTFEIVEGKGRLQVGDQVEATMEPYRSPDGNVTTLNDSIFSTIPGSPAYVAKAGLFRLHEADLGLDVSLHGYNAIQGSFRFEC